eukprot:3246579-Rhodomonas_salina.1
MAKDGFDAVTLGPPEPIGALLDLSLDFNPTSAGEATNLILEFQPQMQLVVGDVLHLQLHSGFSGGSGCFPVWSSVPEAFSFGSWTVSDSTISLPLLSTLSAGTSVKIVISSAASFVLPSEELAANNRDFIVTVQAVAGPVIPTVVPLVSGTSAGSGGSGSVAIEVSNAEIVFNPPKAGDTTSTTISFTAGIDLDEFSSLSITLPGFTGPARVGGYPAGSSGSKFTAVWTLACPVTTVTLFLGEGQNIVEGDAIEVVIPSEFGVSIPVVGIRVNDVSFVLTDDQSGATTIVGPPEPIGALLNLTVDFTHKIAGSPTNIVLDFEPQMNLLVGDMFSVILGDFTGPDIDCIMLASVPEGTFARAKWVEGGSVLHFVVARPVQALQAVRIVVPSTAGIRLPASGLQADGTNLLVNSSSVEGPVPWTVIEEYMPVGSFQLARLESTDGGNGVLTDLTVRFTASMDIMVGELVRVRLPGLMCVDESVCTTVTTGLALGKWNGNQSSFIFNITSELRGGNVSVLELPGVVLNAGSDTQLTASPMGWSISTDARAGEVLSAQLTSSTILGWFERTPIVVFDPAVADAIVNISLSFTLAAAANDVGELSLTLPGFVLPTDSTQGFARFEFDSSVMVYEVGASSVDEAVLLTIGLGSSSVVFPSTSVIDVFIDHLSLKMPASGVRADESGILLRLSRSSG